MVAYDPKRPSTTLSDATRDRLRAAITIALTQPADRVRELDRAELGASIQAGAQEARARSMRPEELIIELKGVLASAVREHPARSVADEQRLREWMVTTCLKAYYG